MDYKEVLKPYVMEMIMVFSTLTGMALAYLVMMLFYYMLSTFPGLANTMGLDLEKGAASHIEANK